MSHNEYAQQMAYDKSQKEEIEVCCVGCNIKVCGYDEEPPHKDSRDEAVCNDCWEGPIIYDCDGCGLDTPNDELWNLSGTSAESYEARTECMECYKLWLKLCEEEETGFGTAYHDGSGFDDCDPEGNGNRLCSEYPKDKWCSECVHLHDS